MRKFNKGDIITNKQVTFRVDNIVKNKIGQGELTWLCEQVDDKFEKINNNSKPILEINVIIKLIEK